MSLRIQQVNELDTRRRAPRVPYWMKRLGLLFGGITLASHALLDGSYLAWVLLSGEPFSRALLAGWFCGSQGVAVVVTGFACILLADWPHHFFEERSR